jgi:hypothetical protein
VELSFKTARMARAECGGPADRHGALMLYARQDAMHADVTGMLLAMYLASWSYALGVGGLVFLSAWVLVRARKNCLDAQEWHKWRN